MMTSKVNILLSTFNGVRFLREQLDSLLRQDYPNISIYIRDDGSTDDTVDLLRLYQEQLPNSELIEENNIGAKRSFLELARSCGNEGELYAFCDQDDIWNPHKISHAVEMIQKSSDVSMTLYCSRLNVVDRNLQPLGMSLIPHHIGFESVLLDCIPYGCTTLIGHGIKQLLVQANPADMISHDFWAYLIATAFGHIVYDVESQILYRQHGRNLAGYETRLWPRLKFKIKEVLERLLKDHRCVDFLHQAERFVATYDNLPSEKRAIVEELLFLKQRGKLLQRLHYICNPKVFSNDLINDVAFKLMVLFSCQ